MSHERDEGFRSVTAIVIVVAIAGTAAVFVIALGIIGAIEWLGALP